MPSGFLNPHPQNFVQAIQDKVTRTFCLFCLFVLLTNNCAFAQSIGTPSTPSAIETNSPFFNSSGELIAQERLAPPSGTILPTDVLPLPAIQNRMNVGENIQLRLFQKLPSRFYFSSSVETSFRYETNPFQFPTKQKLLTQLPPPSTIRILNSFQQGQILDILNLCNNDDMVFRVLPNITGGWTLTPRTRIFTNYFMIRDSLFHNVRLNTVIHSISYGAQHDFPIASRGNLQVEFQCRELYQLHQQPVFDFLPGMTFSYVVTPRLVVFANALAQLRGKRYFQAPTKEIDPFYTWGALYQRNGWTFSASTTFLQNFREPFKQNATIPVNNYSFICDFEVARRLFRSFPGLQGFVRAEPIYNFHSHNRPGLAGVDFRLFFGLRFAMAKPSLLAGLEQLRQQIEEQEIAPPAPNSPPIKQQPNKKQPSAFMNPYELTASALQPIHGPMVENISFNTSEPALTNAKLSELDEEYEHENSQILRTRVRQNTKQIEKIAYKEKDESKEKQEKIEAKKDISMVVIPPFPSVNDSLPNLNGNYPQRSVLH